MNDEKYFIRNLKNYMVENRLSQRELGTKMGCSQAAITHVINEHQGVGMNFVKKFCEVSGMTIAQAFSPDPKQFGGAVEGDVQEGNAVAMMELMKKQMDELKEENKKLEEVEESLRKRIKELQEENELHMETIGTIHHNNVELREENEALKQENLRLVSEGYNAKNEPVKFDKWNLVVDSTDCTGIIDIGGDQIEVYDVADIDPYEKKVLVKLYFDEIHIK